MVKIHLMHDEDGNWEGVYVDGQLRYEGHDVTPQQLLKALELSFTEEYRILSDGRCPPVLDAHAEGGT